MILSSWFSHFYGIIWSEIVLETYFFIIIKCDKTILKNTAIYMVNVHIGKILSLITSFSKLIFDWFKEI